MGTRNGYTLAELLVVLALLAILLGFGLPPVARWRDAAAARAARDEVAAALSWTRLAAVARGGASLVIEPDGRVWTRAGDGSETLHVHLNAHYGVTLDVGGNGAVELRYDALGIGRTASRTLRFTRRDAEAGLTVSAYGRFRRW